MHKKYDAAFKAKVALEAVKGYMTIAEIASEYRVNPAQIRRWKKRPLEELPSIFPNKQNKSEQETQELHSELYKQIGQLKAELDWLKKIGTYVLMKRGAVLSQITQEYLSTVNVGFWGFQDQLYSIRRLIMTAIASFEFLKSYPRFC